MGLTNGVEAVFLPEPSGGVPRAGQVAFWGREVEGHHEIEIVLPHGRGVRRRQVPARVVSVPEALPELLHCAQDSSASVRAWSAATLAGVGLLARGRVLPARTEDGFGSWRTGPLDQADLDWLKSLTRAMPASAYAVPIPDSRPLRIYAAEELVRLYWTPSPTRSYAPPALQRRSMPRPSLSKSHSRWTARPTGWTRSSRPSRRAYA